MHNESSPAPPVDEFKGACKACDPQGGLPLPFRSGKKNQAAV
jgi:hypothetical protein